MTHDDERETVEVAESDVGTMPAGIADEGAADTGIDTASNDEVAEESPPDSPEGGESQPPEVAQEVVDERLPGTSEYADLVTVLNDLAIGNISREEAQNYLETHGLQG